MELDAYGRSYLRLTLEIEKHIAGYVDAYYGPSALKAEVEAAEKKSPAALLDDVTALQEVVPQEGDRRAYAKASLRAMDCTVRMLNGEEFAYLDEVNRLYDISPTLMDEAEFTKAHTVLDGMIDGDGRLIDRLQARKKRFETTPSQLPLLLDLAREETRKRTAVYLKKYAAHPLPADESVDVQLTSGQPWSAYNYYLGSGRSLIEFNTDIPVSALSILPTFAHEGYPGHHTESLLKELSLYREKGIGEQAAMLLHSPAAVIAEGIAVTAVEIIFLDNTHYEWIADILLPAAGMAGLETAVSLQKISRAASKLRYVTGNAAIHYHTGKLNRQQTIEYIQTYGLTTPERAAKSFSFLSHPLYRSYVFTYTQGYDLMKAGEARNGGKMEQYGRLLTEQILPSQL